MLCYSSIALLHLDKMKNEEAFKIKTEETLGPVSMNIKHKTQIKNNKKKSKEHNKPPSLSII